MLRLARSVAVIGSGTIRVGLTRCSICSGVPATAVRAGFRFCKTCEACVAAGDREQLAERAELMLRGRWKRGVPREAILAGHAKFFGSPGPKAHDSAPT
jgi:hypothetical protein